MIETDGKPCRFVAINGQSEQMIDFKLSLGYSKQWAKIDLAKAFGLLVA
ncbi:MAG: hypothetical protein RL154_382 [Pseudomonadota bacterium]|jgi:hypothetical protein